MKRVKNMLGVMVVLLMAFQGMAQTPATLAKNDKSEKTWMLLGTQVVDYTLDRDVVKLNEPTDTYTALKFKVNNGPINLHKCTVHFAGGETQDVAFQTAPSTDGPQIDLYGNTRKIEKVTFWYDTKNSADKKAVVEVWGKK